MKHRKIILFMTREMKNKKKKKRKRSTTRLNENVTKGEMQTMFNRQKTNIGIYYNK